MRWRLSFLLALEPKPVSDHLGIRGQASPADWEALVKHQCSVRSQYLAASIAVPGVVVLFSTHGCFWFTWADWHSASLVKAWGSAAKEMMLQTAFPPFFP